jgi:hypothetical protein
MSHEPWALSQRLSALSRQPGVDGGRYNGMYEGRHMAAVRDWLWEGWTECGYWWQYALCRLRLRPYILNSRPRTCVSNLVMIGVVHSVADRLPCEVTVTPENILEYGAEFRNDGGVECIWEDRARAWRLFWKGSKRFGADAEFRIGGCPQGLLYVNIAFVREPNAVRMTIRRCDTPSELLAATVREPE